MESQLELNEERLKYLAQMNQELPELMVHESAKWEEVYKEGALSQTAHGTWHSPQGPLHQLHSRADHEGLGCRSHQGRDHGDHFREHGHERYHGPGGIVESSEVAG